MTCGSQGGGIRSTSSKFLSARASRNLSLSFMPMRTLHRTSLSFVRFIPAEMEASSFGGDEREMGTYKLRSSPGLPARKGCLLVADHPAAHTSTIETPHTTSRIHLDSKPDPKVPFLRRFGSVIWTLANVCSPRVSSVGCSPESKHDHKSSGLDNAVPPCTESGAKS